jgi:hypothetical protein
VHDIAVSGKTVLVGVTPGRMWPEWSDVTCGDYPK